MIHSPEQVTPEWLTAALHRCGAGDRTARVTEVDITPVGAGRLSRCVRIRLRWSQPGAGPATVVGKFPAADDLTRRTGVLSDGYRRELLFYRRLAPAVRMSVPRCHLAEFEAATGDFVVLLSDAAPARSRDQLRGASPGDVAVALEELVHLQAPFWGGAGLAGHDWLPVHGPATGRRRAAIYQVTAQRFVDRFGSRLSPDARSVVLRFARLVRRWAGAQRPPYTLLHGDFRLDNLLFADGAEAAPLTVVDWQTVAIGPGPNDAAYLVGGALPVPVRRACEEELFQLYRRSLASAGISWGEAACRRSYRLGALAGLHMTVVGAMLVAGDVAGDAMFLSMAERHTTHVIDLEALDAIDADD